MLFILFLRHFAVLIVPIPFLAKQEVTTLGQPLEVLKTQMAANRSQTMPQAFRTVLSRGGLAGFYQGLIPWVRFFEVFPSETSPKI